MPRILELPEHSGAIPATSVVVLVDPTEVLDDNRTKRLLASTFALDTELVALEAEHDALRVEFDTLEGEHDALRGEFDTVEGEHDALRIEFNALEVEHDALAAAMTPVNTQIAALITSANFFRQELLKVMTLEQTDTLLTSSTITDVFIYDTTKDSDGGAWRTRCQALSWYNEPLNTLTRGTTREFPAVALIVAEDDTVTIYDATVVGCPMWMVFLQDGASSSTDSDLFMLGGDFYNDYTSVHAFNGVMSVCSADGGNILGVKGLYRVSFLTDSCKLYYISSVFGGDFAGTISQRNTPVGFLSSSTVSIINRNIYDVAMTVLDDAPIDPDTLLPVPTIAVATAGGISVIDGPAGVGTVVDQVYSSVAATEVHIDSDGRLMVVHGGPGVFVAPIENYTADYSNADLLNHVTNYSGALYRDFGSPVSIPSPMYDIDPGAKSISDGAFGQVVGLTLIKEDTTTPADGMVSYITKDFNTGFMKGDIRRALICDASGLIKDSYFQNPSAWYGIGWTVENGGARHLAGAGYTATLSPSPQVYTGTDPIDYSLTFTISGMTAGNVSISAAGSMSTAYSSNGTFTYDFTGGVLGSIFGLDFQPSADFDGTISKVFWTREDVLTDVAVDTITDRSVKASSLTVVGSLTREPVAAGAELQCISGTKTNNTLTQAYSSDLDFGTGDFFMMGWIQPYSGTADFMIARALGSDGGFFSLGISALSATTYRMITSSTPSASSSFTIVDSLTGAMDTSRWQFLVGQRKDGVIYLYVDTVLQASEVEDAPRDLSSTDATLGIGTLPNHSGNASSTKKLALVRIGAGSLTDDQIAEIYRTELPLFQENAKCTIQGTSNSVNALDYDERYNHLAVGTGDGITIFRDLEVDGYNDAGAMVAVGAKNGALLLGNNIDATWNNGDAITVITE